MCQYPGIVGRQEGDGPGEGGEDRGAKVHWSVTISEGPRWTCVVLSYKSQSEPLGSEERKTSCCIRRGARVGLGEEIEMFCVV